MNVSIIIPAYNAALTLTDTLNSVLAQTSGIGSVAEFWWDTLAQVLLRPGELPDTLRLKIGDQDYEWRLEEWAHYRPDHFFAHQSWTAWGDAPTRRQTICNSLWYLLHSLPPVRQRQVLNEILIWAQVDGTAPQRMLNLDELRALSRNPLIEIGAHTVNHPSLTTLPLALQRTEIANSKRWLETTLGQPVRSFAYPFGKTPDYSPDTISLVRETGFHCAVVNLSGFARPGSDLFQVPRFQVQNWNRNLFAKHLSGWNGQ